MPPKKTKAEEALAFLSDLDSFESEPAAPAAPEVATGTLTPRVSTDSTPLPGQPAASKPAAEGASVPDEDPEAASALAFLEAQLAQKRAPLSKVAPQTNAVEPAPVAADPVASPKQEPASASRPPLAGWGSSWWSTASAALQQASQVSHERFQQVRTDGVGGVAGVAGISLDKIDLDGLRRGAGERLHGISGIVKGVDLEKIRKYSSE